MLSRCLMASNARDLVDAYPHDQPSISHEHPQGVKNSRIEFSNFMIFDELLKHVTDFLLQRSSEALHNIVGGISWSSRGLVN